MAGVTPSTIGPIASMMGGTAVRPRSPPERYTNTHIQYYISCLPYLNGLRGFFSSTHTTCVFFCKKKKILL